MSKQEYPRTYKGHGKHGKRTHRLMAEIAVGHSLPSSVEVHHFGGVAHSEGLVVCENHEYHLLLDMRERAWRVCGNPAWRKCQFCKQYDDIANMRVHRQRKQIKTYLSYHHAACENIYKKNRKASTDVAPLCACGCGRSVNKGWNGAEWNTFIHGHSDPRGWRKLKTNVRPSWVVVNSSWTNNGGGDEDK
jgi:hypothetical protein